MRVSGLVPDPSTSGAVIVLWCGAGGSPWAEQWRGFRVDAVTEIEVSHALDEACGLSGEPRAGRWALTSGGWRPDDGYAGDGTYQSSGYRDR